MKAKLYIPQGPKRICHRVLSLIPTLVVLRGTPEFHKGSHELTLIALRTDVGKTNHQIVLKQTLDYNVPINPSEVKVDGKAINHIKLIIGHIVLEYEVDLGFRDILDASMLNELLEHFEEYAFRVLVGCFRVIDNEAADNFILDDVEQEIKLVGFAEELKRDDYHFEVVLFIEQIVYYLWHLLYLAQLLVYVLNAQHLAVLIQLLLLPTHAQVESVHLLVERSQEDHRAFVLLLYLQQISNESPVAVYIDSKLPLGHEIDLVTGVLIQECISIA